VLLNLTQERQKCFSQYSHSSTSALSSVNLTEQTLHVHPSVGGNDQDGTLTSQLEEFKESMARKSNIIIFRAEE
jgi:hypothetical protein